jgi:formate--tetrahydrofolate ligase
MDMNDRNLRVIQTKQREDKFIITAASEIMAIMAMSKNIFDLKDRIDTILIGFNIHKEPVYVRNLKCADALVLLLKEALNPNLVQTIEGVPTLMHAGPFANIAHGCNSIVATDLALRLGDYVVTEAGFGADLGMEKFLHLKMPNLSKQVDAVVIVVTLRALKLHGGSENYQEPNLEALKKGLPNLEKHLENIKTFGLPYVISVNEFNNDDPNEIEFILNWAKENNHNIALSKGFSLGGDGVVDLANKVVEITTLKNNFKPLYKNSQKIEEKINTIAKTLYGAKGVEYSKTALKQMEIYENLGYKLPICIAKTPMSFSGDPLLKGRPENFVLEINQIRPSLGAGFLVAETKGIMVMPGLNKTPRALNYKLNKDGEIIEVDQ